MAKAAMATLYVDPTARFVNDLITSEIEVSESLLSRVWPSFSAADLLFDAGRTADLDLPEVDDDEDEDDEFRACDGEDDDVEIEFEADEDEDGFFANLSSWSPRKKG